MKRETISEAPLINLKNVKIGRDNIINITGIPPNEYTQIAQKLDVTEDALRQFFRILESKPVPIENLDNKLRQIAETHKNLNMQLGLLKSNDPVVNNLRERAKSAFNEHDYDLTKSLLLEARQKDKEAIKKQKELLEKRQLSAGITSAHLGDLHMAQLEYIEAAVEYNEAIEMIPDSEIELRSDYLNKLGHASYGSEDFVTALEAYTKATEAMISIRGEEDEHVATLFRNQALIYDALGNFDEARAKYEKVINIRETIFGPDHPHRFRSYKEIGNFFYKWNRFDLATIAYKRTHEIMKDALSWNHPEIAVVLTNLADVCMKQNDYSEAENLFMQSADIWAASLGRQHPKYGKTLTMVAEACLLNKDYDQAMFLYKRSIERLFDALTQEGQRGLFFWVDVYTQGYIEPLEYDDILPLYERLLECFKFTGKPDLTHFDRHLNGLLTIYQHSEDKQPYILNLSMRILVSIKDKVETTELILGYAFNLAGLLCYYSYLYNDAIKLFNSALKILNIYSDTKLKDIAYCTQNLARIYYSLNNIVEGEKLYHQTIKLKESVFGKYHPEVAISLSEAAELYYKNNRYQEAKENYELFFSILKKSPVSDGVYQKVIEDYLGRAEKNYNDIQKR